jgi:hypothetical protein
MSIQGRNRNFCGRSREEQPTDYSKLDEHRTRDERVYGLAVYYFLSSAQHTYAGKEFKAVTKQAGQGIRNSFAKSANALNYLAERYATTFSEPADWPT